MRSISLKLTLAFLVVGLSSIVLVAVVVGGQTRREFERFVANQEQLDLAERAAEYYDVNGSWDGLRPGQAARLSTRLPLRRQRVWLLDSEGMTVFGPSNAGRHAPTLEGLPSLPLEVNGEIVGTLVFEDGPMIEGLRQPLEQAYVTAINRSILLSAIVATMLALLLGALLAHTISRPLRELTEATQAVALGEFGRQVPVRTQDELGELAASFNQMSGDLAHSSQMRQQMTADIAHDLRTPLTVILGYTEALNDGKLRGNEVIYRALHRQSLQLSRLIEDLRTLSLADGGELSLHLGDVSPCVLLAQTELTYRAQAQAQAITIRIDCPPGTPFVTVDADRMMQVLGNLVGNALRHTPAEGHVMLRAQATDGQVQLVVADTGSGIAPGDLPYIFDRFYRADQARQSDGATGLGLAIARSLVEAQGGHIMARSEVDGGAEFVVTLPRSTPSEEHPPSDTRPPDDL